MEIKDICIAADQLDDVRGGQYIDVAQLGVQAGLNTAASRAGGWGVGNVTESGASQVAGQSLAQGTKIDAAEMHRYASSIENSVVDFGFPGLMRTV